MGKGSGLAILALIISVGFGGYFIYDKFFVTDLSSLPVTEHWYNYYQAPESVPTGEQWSTYTHIFIEFTVRTNQSVYFSYVGTARLDDSTGDTYIDINFKVDGIRWESPLCMIQRLNTVSTHIERLSVSLQHVNASLSEGVHNVTVTFKGLGGGGGGDSLREQTLFVQTLN